MRPGLGLVATAVVASAVICKSALVTVAAAADQGADPCLAISPKAVDLYIRTIQNALKWAAADAAANGTSGQYAVAASNSRMLLQRALDRAKLARSDLGTDPATTTPAEAGTVKEHVRNILETVPEAAHWAIVSEIYHKSADARKAFDGSVAVLEQGNALYAESGRCYMNL
jgi:hypothetical protein